MQAMSGSRVGLKDRHGVLVHVRRRSDHDRPLTAQSMDECDQMLSGLFAADGHVIEEQMVYELVQVVSISYKGAVLV